MRCMHERKAASLSTDMAISNGGSSVRGELQYVPLAGMGIAFITLELYIGLVSSIVAKYTSCVHHPEH